MQGPEPPQLAEAGLSHWFLSSMIGFAATSLIKRPTGANHLFLLPCKKKNKQTMASWAMPNVTKLLWQRQIALQKIGYQSKRWLNDKLTKYSAFRMCLTFTTISTMNWDEPRGDFCCCPTDFKLGTFQKTAVSCLDTAWFSSSCATGIFIASKLGTKIPGG